MSHLIYGETLVWVSYDPQRVFSAGLRSMLVEHLGAECRVEVSLATSLEQAAQMAEQQRAGLLTLVLGATDEPVAWRTLRRVQSRLPGCVRCVYFREMLMLDELRLRETGAQIVVQQIPWLQRLLPQILSRAPRRSGGNHPLTAGLIDRLPLG